NSKGDIAMHGSKLARIVVSLLLVTVVAAPGLAQGQGGQRRQAARALTLAQVPAVSLQTALGLSADQTKKIADIDTKYTEESRGLRGGAAGGGGGAPDPANRQKLRELGQKATADI